MKNNASEGKWSKEMTAVKDYLSTQYNDTPHVDLLPDYEVLPTRWTKYTIGLKMVTIRAKDTS